MELMKAKRTASGLVALAVTDSGWTFLVELECAYDMYVSNLLLINRGTPPLKAVVTRLS